MTREEAIEVLKRTVGNINYEEGFGIFFTDKWVRAYEMAIAALMEPQWISVKDRLPDDMQERVLALTCGDYPVGNQRMDTDRCRNGQWVRYGYTVTHWMPLPKPPEVDE